MQQEIIKNFLVEYFYICLPVMGVILYLLIKGKKRSQNIFIHCSRVIIEIILVFIIQEYLVWLSALKEFNLFFFLNPSIITAIALAYIFLKEGFLFLTQLEAMLIKKGRDVTSIKFLTLSLKIVYTIALFFIFGEHFGLSLAGLMTFGGVGGLAIGLAAKDILSNFFSGFMIFCTRPFNIGDWISSPDRQIEGIVKEIGWHETVIMTFENRPLYVPNSIFSAISIEDPGQMRNRRIKTSLGLRYDDLAKMGTITQQIQQYLKMNNDIDQTQVILVYFNEFGASSANILLWCYTKTTKWAEWLAVQQKVYLDIIDIVHKNGADFAWNTQLIYLQDQTPKQATTDFDLTPEQLAQLLAKQKVQTQPINQTETSKKEDANVEISQPTIEEPNLDSNPNKTNSNKKDPK